MTRTPAQRLAAYQRRYQQLADQLPEVGFIASGSITERYTRCGTPTCACHADPPRPHGPYWQWTGKIHGKTVTRRLTPAQAATYQQWIDNDRHLHAVIKQMRDIAAQALELALQDDSTPARGQNANLGVSG